MYLKIRILSRTRVVGGFALEVGRWVGLVVHGWDGAGGGEMGGLVVGFRGGGGEMDGSDGGF